MAMIASTKARSGQRKPNVADVQQTGASTSIPVQGAAPADDKEAIRGERLERLAASLKRHSVMDHKPSLALVIGAGVSLGAGVPLCSGWVPLLWRYYCGEPIDRKHVLRVLESQERRTTASKGWRREFQMCGSKTQSKIAKYDRTWLQEHPRHYVEEYQCLMGAMTAADQQKAVAVILSACDPKITWTYLRIAQLVELGYVDSVLTTNLDLVLIKALSLFNVFPAICDYQPAAELRSSHAGKPQVIYLHGNQNSYNVRNTHPAVDTYAEKMKELLRSITRDRTLLVSGYSGWQDGLMSVLRDRYPEGGADAPNEIYWAFAGTPPDQLPLGTNSQVQYIPHAPCEVLFEELAEALGLPLPPLVDKPLQYFQQLLAQIDNSSPRMLTFRLDEKVKQIAAFEKSQGEAKAYCIVAAAQAGHDKRAKHLISDWLQTEKTLSPDRIVELAKMLPVRYGRPSHRATDLRLHLLTAASGVPRFAASASLRRERAERLFRNSEAGNWKSDWAKAVATFREVVKLNPNHPKAWLYLGEALFNTKVYPSAETAFRKQTRLNPKDRFAWSNLGAALENQGDISGAIAAYEKQTKINPNSDYAWNNLGLIYEKKGKLQAAARAFRRQVEEVPRHPYAWNNLGNVLKKLRQFKPAIEAYRRQLEVVPQHQYALSNLAAAHWKVGDLGLAAKAYERWLKESPDDTSSLSNDAELAVIRNDFDRFRKRYKKLSSTPKLSDHTFVVMRFLRWLSDPRENVQDVLNVYNARLSGKKVDWNFSDIAPFVAKLQKRRRNQAMTLIKLFQGRLSRSSLP
jgi:tetratricopeptide (TPR) repeat protein